MAAASMHVDVWRGEAAIHTLALHRAPLSVAVVLQEALSERGDSAELTATRIGNRVSAHLLLRQHVPQCSLRDALVSAGFECKVSKWAGCWEYTWPKLPPIAAGDLVVLSASDTVERYDAQKHANRMLLGRATSDIDPATGTIEIRAYGAHGGGIYAPAMTFTMHASDGSETR